MNKPVILFEKISKKKRDTFLSDDMKNTISGSVGGLVSTVSLYPQDTIANEKQVTNKQNFKTKSLKDIWVNPKPAKFKEVVKGKSSFQDMFKAPKPTSFNTKLKNTAKFLGRKYYGGIGWKLTKTVPAAALTFGTVGATRKFLDEIDPPKTNV